MKNAQRRAFQRQPTTANKLIEKKDIFVFIFCVYRGIPQILVDESLTYAYEIIEELKKKYI